MRGLFAIAIAALCACGNHEPYVCASPEQCKFGGVQGVCEPTGFCSFDDSACEGGRRYEANAGNGLGGTCIPFVPPPPPPPPPEVCGAVTQTCCSSGPACISNGLCTTGKCTACVTDVGLGRHASCVLRYDGTVWCAGANDLGQLGSGTTSTTPIAVWTQSLATGNVAIADATAIAAHGDYACAVRAGGAVWCWGSGFGSLAVPVVKTDDTPLTNIVEIDAGFSFQCGRDTTGGVWCWGTNSFGELGDGTMSATPRPKAAPVLDALAGPALTGALSLTLGYSHACVRKTGNTVWCWGRNTYGQLGDTFLLNRASPVMVTTATSVTAGQWHTCSVHLDGTVWCSGLDWRNRLGYGIPYNFDIRPHEHPVAAQVVMARGGPPLANVTQVAAGGVSCALSNKTVYCWGDNTYGQVGTGTGSPTPMPVLTTDGKPLTGIQRIVAHGPHVCAFRDDGELLCWGRGIDGMFGDKTFLNRGFARPLGFTCP